MTHQGQFHHTLLIGYAILIWEELFACLLLLTIAQADAVPADSFHHNTIQIIINGAKTLSDMEREGLACMVCTCQLHVDTVPLHGRQHLHLLFSHLAARQFQMLFGNTFDKPLIKGVCRIQVVDQFLVILHCMLVLALTDCQFREGGTIAQHELGTEVLNQSSIRFAATLNTMWLVDDQHRLRMRNCIHRTMEIAQHLVIVLTSQQLAIGDELSVQQ